MILVDTSVWIDHLRAGDEHLVRRLEGGQVLSHPAVIGEIALGHLTRRVETLTLLSQLPRTVEATHDEVLHFIEAHHLFGRGIGYVDAQLLAAAVLTPDATLWTRDRRLHAAAEGVGVASPPP